MVYRYCYWDIHDGLSWKKEAVNEKENVLSSYKATPIVPECITKSQVRRLQSDYDFVIGQYYVN